MQDLQPCDLDFFADIYCPQSIISRAHLFCCLKRISILSHPPHQTCPTNQLPRRSRCVCACSSVATAGLAFGHGASRFDLIHSIPMHFRPKPIFMGCAIDCCLCIINVWDACSCPRAYLSGFGICFKLSTQPLPVLCPSLLPFEHRLALRITPSTSARPL